MACTRCLRGLASSLGHPADQLMNLDPEEARPVEMVLDNLGTTPLPCLGCVKIRLSVKAHSRTPPFRVANSALLRQHARSTDRKASRIIARSFFNVMVGEREY